jgi:hypothetical protein
VRCRTQPEGRCIPLSQLEGVSTLASLRRYSVRIDATPGTDDVSTPRIMSGSTIAPELILCGRYQDQGNSTLGPLGVASFRTPYLQTISRRRHPIELQRGMQRPSVWVVVAALYVSPFAGCLMGASCLLERLPITSHFSLLTIFPWSIGGTQLF